MAVCRTSPASGLHQDQRPKAGRGKGGHLPAACPKEARHCSTRDSGFTLIELSVSTTPGTRTPIARQDKCRGIRTIAARPAHVPWRASGAPARGAKWISTWSRPGSRPGLTQGRSRRPDARARPCTVPSVSSPSATSFRLPAGPGRRSLPRGQHIIMGAFSGSALASAGSCRSSTCRRRSAVGAKG
jgi:hypothetical protein